MSEPSFREGLEFLAPLLEQSARDLAYTTNALTDSLAKECAESAARLQLIAEAVEELLEKPYAPSSSAILGCLRPTRHELEELTREILTERGIHSSVHGSRESKGR